MTTCGYPLSLLGAVLFLVMVLLCLTCGLSNFRRARRQGQSGWCCGASADKPEQTDMTEKK